MILYRIDLSVNDDEKFAVSFVFSDDYFTLDVLAAGGMLSQSAEIVMLKLAEQGNAGQHLDRIHKESLSL